ncbi:hypothetical protein [Streptomyces sp. NPDC059491]|uniref:hypothetical protein n=1 Tax=Streptomyces sp. NPDC059491 TaxID=3346850 RepID=UPI003673A3A4
MRYRADHEGRVFTGGFRRELDNITFTGEREAAERTVEAYALCQRDDRTIRSLSSMDITGTPPHPLPSRPPTYAGHQAVADGRQGGVNVPIQNARSAEARRRSSLMGIEVR